MTKFKYASLFSGIGGFETALNNLGGECVFASEIDKYAKQSYEALYDVNVLYGDVTKIEATDVPDHDILVGGFPCQAFSVAGKRRGFEDTRGTLFFEALRIAKEKQPKTILLENVKGLISHDKGQTLDVMITALSEIGYTVDFDVLNSKHFGVPQNRERIFIVGIRDDLIKQQPWIIKGTTVVPKAKQRLAQTDGVKTFNFNFPQQTEVNIHLRDVLESHVDESYYLSEEKTAALMKKLNVENQIKFNNVKVERIIQLNGDRNKPALSTNEESAYCVPANPMSDRGQLLQEPKNSNEQGLFIREATKQGYAIAKEGDAVNFQFPDSKTRRGRVGKQIANTLEASNVNQGVVTQEYRIRKLTPLETWRLQGFTDEQHQKAVDAGLSDSQRYKQAGNAVTVNVIEAIGKNLLEYIIE